MTEHLSPALRAVSDAVLAVASQLSVDEVLQRLVDAARELAGARYAALGIPDGEGGFRRFLVSGMSGRADRGDGPAARARTGCSARCSRRPCPYLTDDIHDDPRFRGWWPRRHPDMRSFLGVPIVARGEVIGAFYLTEKIERRSFEAGRSGADRAACRARVDRDHQRAAVRAHPRAVDRLRTQPPRARAPRRRQPEAVQPRSDRRGGEHAARPRSPPPPAGRSSGSACSRVRRSRSCAR